MLWLVVILLIGAAECAVLQALNTTLLVAQASAITVGTYTYSGVMVTTIFDSDDVAVKIPPCQTGGEEAGKVLVLVCSSC
jgi:hypothetical protein